MKVGGNQPVLEVQMNRTKQAMTRRAFAASGLGAFAALGLAQQAFGQAPVSVGAPVPPEVERANVAVVNDFCAAFARKDMAKITSLLADTCAYRVTQARPAMVGPKAVADFFQPFMDRGEISFKVLKTVVLGPVVINERDDLLPGTGNQPSRLLHIHAGMFFVQDGKILEWTDYILR
jgi:limonene-1,2-epoxide hydrolase